MNNVNPKHVLRVVATCLMMVGCSDPAKVKTPTAAAKSSDAAAGAPAPAASPDPAGGEATTPATDGEPAAAEAKAEPDADNASGSGGDQVADAGSAPADTAPAVPANDPALTQLIDDCGGSELLNAGANDKVFAAKMPALGFTVPPQFGVTAHLKAALDITATPSQTKESVKVEVTYLNGFFALFGMQQAKDQAAQNSGTMTYTNVPFSTLPKLGDKYPDWRGVVCAVLGASDLVSQFGDKSTTVQFDPPLPTSVQPNAAASRIATEIGDKKIFKDIKVSIVKTNNPVLNGMTSVTGKVTITKVSPNATFKDDAGTTYNVRAESAYLMTYEFKSPAVTFALGLTPSVTFYLQNSKRKMIANTVDTSGAGGANVTFMAP